MYITELTRRLDAGARVTVLTGAGVSAASGVPTFRGPDGLWRRFRAEELATPGAFARDPRLVWEWYDWRRGLIAACRPNRAHEVLADWGRRLPGFALVTQNVDGLHEAAGSIGVVGLHGSIWHVRCAEGCPAGARAWRDDRVPIIDAGTLPRCPHCRGLLRPDVVWFGEPLDDSVLARAVAATRCSLFVAVGTSAMVYPAAGLLHEAKGRGAFTVEINPQATEASELVDLAIREPAEIALAAIDRARAGKHQT